MNPHISPPLRRTIALGLLVVLLALAWAIVIQPVWVAWSTSVSNAELSQDLIARLRAIAAETPALRAQAAKSARSEQDRALVFSAANANLAAVELQTEVKQILAAYGTEIQSIRQLPAKRENDLDLIALHVEFQCNSTQLARILGDLNLHAPKLFVHNLSVQGSEQIVSLNRSLPLYVQIEVIAYASGPD